MTQRSLPRNRIPSVSSLSTVSLSNTFPPVQQLQPPPNLVQIQQAPVKTPSVQVASQLIDENNNENNDQISARRPDPIRIIDVPEPDPAENKHRHVETVTMATSTDDLEEEVFQHNTTKPQPTRRISLDARKSEGVQTSDNDSDMETAKIIDEILNCQEKKNRTPAKRTDSESSNCSTHRKSVSFDLDEGKSKVTPVDIYSGYHGHTITTDYHSGNSDLENDVFSRPERRRGILRSPSPYSTLERENKTVVVMVDKEIERENPFRDEALGINVPKKDQQPQEPDKNRPVSLYNHDYSWTFDRIQKNVEDVSKSSVDVSKSEEQDFKNKIDAAKSMSELNRQKKPILPPKPLNIKKANLVYNEGIEDINKKMAQGDFVEYEHDPRTNTIKEVPRPFSPERPLSPASHRSSVSRQKSVERPKERPPPPPPVIKKNVPPPDRFERVSAHFDNLPLPKTPEWIHENSKTTVFVTEDEHREIMLNENELRRSIQSDLHLMGLMGPQVTSPTNPFLNNDSSDNESFLSSIAPEFSPVSTLQRPVSPSQIFPPAERVPVHLKDLPKPQHPYLRPSSRLENIPNMNEVCDEDEDGTNIEEDSDDDGVDIDSYLAKENSKWAGNANRRDEFYTTASFSTFSGKETQV